MQLTLTRNWWSVGNAALAAIALSLIVFGFVRNLPSLGLDAQPVDLAAYYSAGAMLNSGDPQAIYEFQSLDRIAKLRGAASVTSYIYLPFLAVLMRPLALLPFQSAVAIWLVCNLALLCITCRLLLSLARVEPTVSRTVIAFAFCLILPPVTTTLLLGQINLVLLALLTASVYLLDAFPPRSRREMLAGLILGIAIAIKLYPAVLLVPMIIRRRWAPVAWSIASVCLALAVGILGAGGISNTVRYLLEVLPRMAPPELAVNQSLFAAIRRVLESNEYRFSVFSRDNEAVLQARSLIESPAAVGPVVVLITLLIALVTLWGLRRLSAKAGAIRFDLSLGLTTSLIVLPLVWDHYHTLLLIPWATVISVRRQAHSNLLWSVLLVAVLFLSLHRYWRVMAYAGFPFALLSFGFLGVFLTWLFMIYLTRVD